MGSTGASGEANNAKVEEAIYNLKRSVNKMKAGRSMNTVSRDIVSLPCFVLKSQTSKTGKSVIVTVKIMAFDTFKSTPIKPTNRDPKTGAAQLEIVRDMRTAEKRAKHAKEGQPEDSFSKNYIHDIMDIDDVEERYDTAYDIVTEGDIIRLVCMDMDVDARSGDIAMADIEFVMYHKKEGKTVQYMRKLTALRNTVRMPAGLLFKHLFMNGWLTTKFRTEFVEYADVMRHYNGQPPDDIKKRHKYGDKVFMIPTGVPVDRNPNLMEANSCILWDVTDVSTKDNFVSKDMHGKERQNLHLTYSGKQWPGDPGDHSDIEAVGGQHFVIRMPLYKEQLEAMQIATISAWGVFSSIFTSNFRGIYIGSENLEQSAQLTVNSESYAQITSDLSRYGVTSEDQLTNEQRIEIVNQNKPKDVPHHFGMAMQPSSYIFDLVDFLQRVAVPITADKVKEYFGGTKVPQDNELTQNRDLRAVNNVICLTECTPGTDIDTILGNPERFEFRALMTAKPSSGAKKCEEYFDELEDLDPTIGNQLFDYILNVYEDMHQEYVQRNANIASPEHIVGRYHPLQKYSSDYTYIYAIDVKTHVEQCEKAAADISSIMGNNNNKLAENTTGQKRDHLSITDGSEKQDPPAKRPRMGERTTTMANLAQDQKKQAHSNSPPVSSVSENADENIVEEDEDPLSESNNSSNLDE